MSRSGESLQLFHSHIFFIESKSEDLFVLCNVGPAGMRSRSVGAAISYYRKLGIFFFFEECEVY